MWSEFSLKCCSQSVCGCFPFTNVLSWIVHLTYNDLLNCVFSGESAKVKAEKVEAVVAPQGNDQQKMFQPLTDDQFRKSSKVLISHLCLILCPVQTAGC